MLHPSAIRIGPVLVVVVAMSAGCRAEADPPPGGDDDTSTPTPTGCPGSEIVVYPDGDGDGYGLDAGAAPACAPATDEVLVGGDCDDADPQVFPGADDAPYDGADGDCAGDSDFDADGDGHDRVPEGDDCDDADAEVSPTTTVGDAACDGVDQDCDGRGPVCELDIASLSVAWTGLLEQRVGSSVAFVGDLSGDGIEDIFVGAVGKNATNRGAAAVLFGPSPVGGVAWDVADATFEDAAAPDWEMIGLGGAHAGDVNQDGYEDLWVGGDHAAWLYLGPIAANTSMSRDDSVASVSFWGSGDAHFLGGRDLDGDGYAELVIGPAGDHGVQVVDGPFVGSIDTESGGATMTIINPGCISYYGELLAYGGDTDGDGVQELLVAEDAPCFVPTIGKPALVPGNRTGTVNTATDATVTTFTVAAHGAVTGLDHDEDGYSDLAMQLNASTVVLPGPFPLGEVDQVSWASTTLPGFVPVAGADLDGDGQQELVLHDNDRIGLLSGTKAGALGVDDVEYWVLLDPASAISSLATGTDLDGDGTDDMLVGQQYSGAGGTAHLVVGGPFDFSP